MGRAYTIGLFCLANDGKSALAHEYHGYFETLESATEHMDKQSVSLLRTDWERPYHAFVGVINLETGEVNPRIENVENKMCGVVLPEDMPIDLSLKDGGLDIMYPKNPYLLYQSIVCPEYKIWRVGGQYMYGTQCEYDSILGVPRWQCADTLGKLREKIQREYKRGTTHFADFLRFLSTMEV